MSTQLLRTIQGEGFESKVWYVPEEGKCFWIGDWDNDCDGPNGNPDKDKYWQPETSLRLRGQSIDSYKVPGIVVPLWLPAAVGPIVLGCLARVTDLRTMKQIYAVVYDKGPTNKVGEGSCRAAKLLGINPNPNNGGVDQNVILFECWPGKAALIEGIQYDLQKS